MTGRDGTPPTSRHNQKKIAITPTDVIDHVQPHALALLERAAQDIIDAHRYPLVAVALHAASDQTTLTDACRGKTNGPSRRTLARDLTTLDLDELQVAINDALWSQSVDRIPDRPKIAVDLTLIPYHGQPHQADDELTRSQAQEGTTWFHAYATLYVCEPNKRHTLLVRYLRRGDTPTTALTDLVTEALDRGLRPRLVLVDKGFCTLDAVRLLRRFELPFIVPLPLRGDRAKALCRGRASHWATYQLGGPQGETVRVAVVIKRNQGKYHGKKPGNQYFPYIADRVPTDNPRQVYKWYSKRPGVESSYRLMNRARARTSSQNPAVRLFYVALAFLLQNAWVVLAWVVSMPRQGGRFRPAGHFPLKQCLRFVRAWFRRRYGARLEVVQVGRREGVS